MKKISAAKINASIETISILGMTENMAPLGLHWYAKMFFEAAILLPVTDCKFNPVPLYLLCHSIELSLKAFLSLKNISMLDSANYCGHNLSLTLASAENNDLQSVVEVSKEQREVINLASIYYLGKVFEYPAIGEAMRGYEAVPNFELLTSTAKNLIDSLQKSCSEA